MIFESSKGKMVVHGRKMIRFNQGVYETEDKEEIKLLESLKDVKKKARSKQSD